MSETSFLPVRLKRETPFKSQLGCTGVIALVMCGVAVFAWFAGRQPGENSWVAYVVSAGFGLFGVLVVWSFIRQVAAIGLAETIVEISTEPLQPGEAFRVCVIQTGPAKLNSLRANLVCMEERTHNVRNSQTKRSEPRVQEKLLSTENLIEAKHLHVAAGDAWHEVREFTLPADAPVTGTKEGVSISWKIEVWGTGYGLASVMHPFPVDVFRGQRPEEEEGDGDEEEREAGAP